MLSRQKTNKDSKILILGVTFKENCPDIRNTKVVDMVHTFDPYTKNIEIYDPWASIEDVKHEYGLTITNKLPNHKFDTIILAVAHNEFLNLDLRSLLVENGVLYDVKNILPKEEVDGRL